MGDSSATMNRGSSRGAANTVVLLGRTGDGKSSLANLIVGKKVFSESAGASSCTQEVQSQESDGIVVLDTPGLQDTSGDSQDERNIQTIIRTLKTHHPIVKGFVFVFNAQNLRCDNGLQVAFAELANAFGIEFLSNVAFAFTHCEKDCNLEEQGRGFLNSFARRLGIEPPASIKVFKVDCHPEVKYEDIEGIAKEIADRMIGLVKAANGKSLRELRHWLINNKDYDCNGLEIKRTLAMAEQEAVARSLREANERARVARLEEQRVREREERLRQEVIAKQRESAMMNQQAALARRREVEAAELEREMEKRRIEEKRAQEERLRRKREEELREVRHPSHTHPLLRSTGDGHTCDVCGRTIRGELQYSCRPCNFDICTQCFENVRQNQADPYQQYYQPTLGMLWAQMNSQYQPHYQYQQQSPFSFMN